jgi:sugar phosphate isomerase/epimerase
LEVISNHVGLKDLKTNFENIVEYHKELGCSSLVIANIPNVFFEDQTTVQNAVDDLMSVQEKLKSLGFSIALHNCPFTFVSPESYRLFEQELDSSLPLQPDAGNAVLVGIDPVEYFSRLDNRFVSLHIKDAKPADSKNLPLNSGAPGKENDSIFEKFSRYSTPIGKGTTDLKAFIQLGTDRGVEWFVIEEEMTEAPLKTIKEAIEYIKGLH